MSLCSINDILNEIPENELAKMTGDPLGETINFDRVEHCIDCAEAMVNAYLFGRYRINLNDEGDPIIKKIATDLSVVYLNEFYYNKSNIPQTIIFRKLDSFRLLKEIQKGNVSISGTKPSETSPPAIITNKESRNKVFSNNLLEKM